MNRTIGPIEILFNDHHGQYIPRMFAEDCSPAETHWHYDEDDRQILLQGPDHELYWDTWDDVLNTAYYLDPNDGRKFTLMQDSDLFAIQEGYYLDDSGNWIDPDGNVFNP